MNKKTVSLLLLEDGAHRPAASMSFAPDEQLEVRDTRARATATVPAAEVSLYRHTVILRGKAYRILNIFSPFRNGRAA